MSELVKINNRFIMDNVEHLTHEALDAITIDDYKKCVRLAENIQDLNN